MTGKTSIPNGRIKDILKQKLLSERGKLRFMLHMSRSGDLSHKRQNNPCLFPTIKERSDFNPPFLLIENLFGFFFWWFRRFGFIFGRDNIFSNNLNVCDHIAFLQVYDSDSACRPAHFSYISYRSSQCFTV